MDIGTLIYLSKRLNAAVQSAAITVPVDPPLTLGEMAVIGILVRQNKPVSIKDIVGQSGMAQSWASKTVQDLRKRGWVNIKAHSRDRRVTYVSATPEVVAAAATFLAADASGILSNILPDATKSEMMVIGNGLARLASLLKRNDPSSTIL